jgi:hypothetical protein
MNSALKVNHFQPDFVIYFVRFLPPVIMPQNPKRPPNLGAGKTEYFKHVKICGITLGIL